MADQKKRRRRFRYPGEAEAQKARSGCKAKPAQNEEPPDFVAGAPNYDKFRDWSPEKVLVWLNID